jgi:hypothetical protein
MSADVPPRPAHPAWLVPTAVVLALVGLTVSVAHFLFPTPLLFALFMIVGQGSFAVAMVLYASAIVLDLRAKKVL